MVEEIVIQAIIAVSVDAYARCLICQPNLPFNKPSAPCALVARNQRF